MSFTIIHGDITTLKVDAIVNPTDQWYSGGGGVDFLIHQKCGQALKDELSKFQKLHLGEAKATESYRLPCKYIIHTSGPYWMGTEVLEKSILGSCYRNSVFLARTLGCRTIAFPVISSRGKGFPHSVALTVAVNAIQECVDEYQDIDIVLVIYGKFLDSLPSTLFDSISKIISESYVPEEEIQDVKQDNENVILSLLEKPTQKNLDKIKVDKSFSETLKKLLKEKKIKQCYVQDEIGVSGVAFHKILKGKANPKRENVFGIAIALKLSVIETEDLLMKAGYCVNKSSLWELVLYGLIKNEIFERETINNLFEDLDLPLLPGSETES